MTNVTCKRDCSLSACSAAISALITRLSSCSSCGLLVDGRAGGRRGRSSLQRTTGGAVRANTGTAYYERKSVEWRRSGRGAPCASQHLRRATQKNEALGDVQATHAALGVRIDRSLTSPHRIALSIVCLPSGIPKPRLEDRHRSVVHCRQHPPRQKRASDDDSSNRRLDESHHRGGGGDGDRRGSPTTRGWKNTNPQLSCRRHEGNRTTPPLAQKSS